jgi:hypothetical protein
MGPLNLHQVFAARPDVLHTYVRVATRGSSLSRLRNLCVAAFLVIGFLAFGKKFEDGPYPAVAIPPPAATSAAPIQGQFQWPVESLKIFNSHETEAGIF